MNTNDTGIICSEKRIGETMGELTARIRKERSLEGKMTFAGRLDPLASGLVIFLIGDKRFEKDKFLNLDKEYAFDIVFDVLTDSGDPLGIVEKISNTASDFSLEEVRKAANLFARKHVQTYPFFSSPRISANQRREKEVEIFNVSVENISKVPREHFLKQTLSQIALVTGDFRQDEIVRKWKNSSNSLPEDLTVAHCTVHCSSGTYVRVLAQKMGEELSVPALAQNINRTAVGNFTKTQIIV